MRGLNRKSFLFSQLFDGNRKSYSNKKQEVSNTNLISPSLMKAYESFMLSGFFSLGFIIVASVVKKYCDNRQSVCNKNEINR